MGGVYTVFITIGESLDECIDNVYFRRRFTFVL